MSRSKTLLELVQDRAFRPSRHFDLLFTDESIADLLNEVIAGHVELPRGEYVRLSWIEYWAEGVHTGKADRGIAMLNLVNAIRGAHPVYAAEPGSWDS